MKNVIFITGATATQPYIDHLVRLTRSLEEHNLTYHVYEFINLGNWNLNAQQKAHYIQRALKEFWYKEGIVWLDADCEVLKPPVFFDKLDCDFACHYKDGKELLSGTLYFGTNRVHSTVLVETWVSTMQNEPKTWDQKVLQRVVEEMKRTTMLKVVKLPPNYVQIFDIMKHHGEPVIQHYQASRETRCP